MQPKIFGRQPAGALLERIRRSPNYSGNGFKNPIPTRMDVNPYKVAKEYWISDSSHRRPKNKISINRLRPIDYSNIPSKSLKVSWLGHASTIVEIGGLRIMTDPVLSDRVSPFRWSGPKRLHASPLQHQDIPHIDAIVISHNHYDHLDFELITYLRDRDIQFITPLGVGESLRYWGIPNKLIYELDWHDDYQMGGVNFTATPARHFTGRGLLDRNKTLWASFVIEHENEKLFFCGDSGFFPGFADIGKQYGPFDITMIGVGAYNVEWHAIHTNPKEAVEAHQLLFGKHLLPIHWCTFDLALHSWDEPIEWTIREANEEAVSLLLPKPRQMVDASGKHINEMWWR